MQQSDNKFHGRRFGRPLKKGRKRLIEECLPKVQIRDNTLDQQLQTFIDLASSKNTPVWLEIGFGAGEHLAGLVQAYPNHYFLGCEPFINGVAQCLKYFDEDLEQNDYTKRVRIWTDSAQLLLDALPEQSLERVYLLNPDPWPKTRHHKRRFIHKENLDKISRALKAGGLFITATDVEELAEWMLEKTIQHGDFEWQAHCKADWLERPSDWITTTRYAEKGAEAGRYEIYLSFTKTS